MVVVVLVIGIVVVVVVEGGRKVKGVTRQTYSRDSGGEVSRLRPLTRRALGKRLIHKVC